MTNLQVVNSPPFQVIYQSLLSYSFFQTWTPGMVHGPGTCEDEEWQLENHFANQTSESSWKNVEDQDGFLWDFSRCFMQMNLPVESDCNCLETSYDKLHKAYVLSFWHVCLGHLFCQTRFFCNMVWVYAVWFPSSFFKTRSWYPCSQVTYLILPRIWMVYGRCI